MSLVRRSWFISRSKAFHIHIMFNNAMVHLSSLAKWQICLFNKPYNLLHHQFDFAGQTKRTSWHWWSWVLQVNAPFILRKSGTTTCMQIIARGWIHFIQYFICFCKEKYEASYSYHRNYFLSLILLLHFCFPGVSFSIISTPSTIASEVSTHLWVDDSFQNPLGICSANTDIT